MILWIAGHALAAAPRSLLLAAVPEQYDHNHLTELVYELKTAWPFLLAGVVLTCLPFVLSAVPSLAGIRQPLVLAGMAMGLLVAAGFLAYWVTL